MSPFLRKLVLLISIQVICAVSGQAMDQNQEPSIEQIVAMTELFAESESIIQIDSLNSDYRPYEPEHIPSWSSLKDQMLLPDSSFYAPGNQPPFIMMAGYMDTEISWEDGGTFTMVAWAWDPDNDVTDVELYFDGESTGVYLLDDGSSGDFGAGDSIYGLTLEVPEHSLPPGEYILELKAHDSMGNLSDLWPYLTIHP